MSHEWGKKERKEGVKERRKEGTNERMNEDEFFDLSSLVMVFAHICGRKEWNLEETRSFIWGNEGAI